MEFPIILAHGELGNFDELIFLGIVVIFFAAMGISWFISRNVELKEPTPTIEDQEQQDAEHFRLD